jgi:hypothetical protein
MNAPRPPSEEEIDRLLASRLRDTTPAFEARWRDLRRELRNAPAPRRRWLTWPVWSTGLAAAGVTLAVLLVLRPWTPAVPPPTPAFSPVFAELLEMDDVLARATPLLDPENREVLLHLPAQPSPQI